MGARSYVLVRGGEGEWLLESGEKLSFGRGAVDTPVDIALSDDRHLSALGGRITAGDDAWEVENLNRWAPIRVCSDGLDSTLRRGASMLVKARSAVISLQLDGQTTVTLEVDIVSRPDDGGPSLRSGPESSTVPPLTRGTLHHYAVLVLCESRLRTGRLLHIPSNKAIAAVFRERGIDLHATEDRVETYLRYARERLALIVDPGYHESKRGNDDGSARVALVGLAIETGAVIPTDLELLDRIKG